MVRKSQENLRVIESSKTIFLLLAVLIAGAALPGAVFACDVTSVTLYLGRTHFIAISHNTSTVYRSSGDSFWFHVHWSADTPDDQGFDLVIYDYTTSETLTTRSITSPTQRTYTGSTTLQTYSFVPHTIKAKMRRKPSGDWFWSSGRTLTVFKVDIDTPASFPAYVGLDDTLQLGSTIAHFSAGGGTYSWSKVTGPGTVTFSPSANSPDPTFSADQSGNYTVKVEYTKDGSTVSDTSGTITVVEIKSETESEAPAGERDRTLLGIGEQVRCWVEPSITVNWSVTGDGGSIYPLSGSETTFTAVKSNATPKYATIHAELPGSSNECTIDFTIIKPTGEINVWAQDEDHAELGPPDLYMCHWHVFEAFVQPTTVSFYNVSFRENIPLNEWEWPDGTPNSYGPLFLPFSVWQNNMWGDGCNAWDNHVSLLNHPIEGPIDFDIDLDIPEQFQDDAGEWWTFLPDGSHLHEFRASDYRSKGTILDDNVPTGQTWRGPYKTSGN